MKSFLFSPQESPGLQLSKTEAKRQGGAADGGSSHTGQAQPSPEGPERAEAAKGPGGSQGSPSRGGRPQGEWGLDAVGRWEVLETESLDMVCSVAIIHGSLPTQGTPACGHAHQAGWSLGFQGKHLTSYLVSLQPVLSPSGSLCSKCPRLALTVFLLHSNTGGGTPEISPVPGEPRLQPLSLTHIQGPQVSPLNPLSNLPVVWADSPCPFSLLR